MLAKINKYVTGFMVVSILLISSCRKESNQVPNVLVDIQVNINNPGYIDLQVVGGWKYFEGGSRGIIVYRRSYDEFVAFDRHCTYQVESSCGQVSVDSTNVIAVDNNCCGSRFLITDGSVQSTPATMPLKQYQVYWDGSAILRIYN
jgi:nitrite reductase/ring-hydroxylating ferredoxin subunit